jgi:dihydrofolate reductase
MKTTLYASLSVNGHVLEATAGHEVPPEILNDFLNHARRTGNVVIGRRTFDLMAGGGSAEAFAGVDVVVLSRQRRDLSGGHPVGSPEEATRLLADRGHTEALLAGGPTAYHAFLEGDLVDELIVNITPVLTGAGSDLTPGGAKSTALRLVDLRRLSEGETQLHYQLSR